MSGASGWGKDSWGVDPWGSAVPLAPLVIDGAVAISTKELQVSLNRRAQTIAPTVTGDALNPATWTIQRIDTGFFFSVLAVTQVGEFEFVLSVLQDFGSASVTHRVLSTTLLDSDGGPISQPPLNRADFLGLLSVERKDVLASARQQSNAVRDVQNPPQPVDNIAGGTLVIGSSGDYALESGPALLKKLIIRRLITAPGGFVHLPDYGVGLQVKEVLPAANLIQLRAKILRQIRREPEVEEVDVRLNLGVQNDLTIRVQVKTRSGDAVGFSFSPQSAGVVL